MIACELIKKKEFKSVKMKDAYLEACKWVSTNIIAKNNCRNITYRMYKKKQSLLENVIEVEIYAYVEEEEVLSHHCEICKELARGLYMKENRFRCEVCKIEPFMRRLKERIETIKIAVKGEIDI